MMDGLILDILAKEAESAKHKHGDFPEDPNVQLRILIGEVGELAEAVRDAEHERGPWSAVEGEAIQVAVTAIKIYEAIEHRKTTNPKPGSVAHDGRPWIDDGPRIPKGYNSLDPPPEAAISTVRDWLDKHQNCGGVEFNAQTDERKCACGARWRKEEDA